MGKITALASLVTAVAVCGSAGGARAELTEGASLRGLGGEVSEASHSVDIAIQGMVAVGTTRQSVVATTAAEAVYTFQMPASAAVTGLTVRLPGGRTTRAEVVDASWALQNAPEAEGARPDVALLRLLRIDGALSTYELRVHPVPAGRSISWTLSWLAPLHYADGRLSLQLPARRRSTAAASNLVTEKVSVSGSMPRGFERLRAVIGSGRHIGKRLPARFTASPSHGVSLELLPEARSTAPVMEMAAVPLPRPTGDPDQPRSAVAFSLLAPLRADAEHERVSKLVVVIDSSRSMSQSGRRATARLVRAMLDDAPASAEVAAVLFDREARSAWKGFRQNDAAARDALKKAIDAAPQRNGSDLAGAVALVEKLMDSRPGQTRIVIFSDALTPLDQTPGRIAQLASTRLLRRARVAHVAVVPEGAPLPMRREVAASGLVHDTRGRLLTVRHLEVPQRADSLWGELWAAPPLRDIELSGQEHLLAEQPLTLRSGSGTFAVGFYRGAPPRNLKASAAVVEKEISVASRPRPAYRKLILPLLLAPMQTLPDGFDDLSLRDLAMSHGVVTRATALWAGYPGDAFASSRLAQSRKFGAEQFRRLPPPLERGELLASYQFVNPPPDPSSPPPMTSSYRPTGTLDRNIVERLMRTYVVPRVHGCYRRALLPAKDLRGSLTVVVEMSRGEVQSARIDGNLTGSSKWAAQVATCALNAAYSIQVPSVSLGGGASEEVSVVRYPLNFQIVDSKGRVIEGPRKLEEVDADDPLDGITDQH